MVSLQYVLEEGNRDGWFESRTITALAAVAAISLIGSSARAGDAAPRRWISVFANRGYSAATALNFLVGTASLRLAALSLYCGTHMHYRALEIGHVFLLGKLDSLLIFPLAGRLVTRIDPRLLMLLRQRGHLHQPMAQRPISPQTPIWATIANRLFIRAVGTGIGFVPLTFLAWPRFHRRSAGRHRPVQPDPRTGRLDRHRLDEHHARPQSKRAFTFITSHVDPYGAVVADQATLLEHGPGAACSILRTPPWPS